MVEKHRKANVFLICITFITKGLLKIQTSENRGHTFVLLSRRGGGLLHFFAQRAIFLRKTFRHVLLLSQFLIQCTVEFILLSEIYVCCSRFWFRMSSKLHFVRKCGNHDKSRFFLILCRFLDHFWIEIYFF